MASHMGLSPRELAALDQFGARFRDMQAELCASLRRAEENLAAMASAFAELDGEIRVTALQLAIEDTETAAAHPDIAELDTQLDGYYGDTDA